MKKRENNSSAVWTLRVIVGFFVSVLLASGAATARAQSALDGFDPNANGTIRVIVVQPDGKILIGGDFTTVAPNGGAAVTRNRIARLNPDGTLDNAFNPNASDVVYTMAVQSDGKVLVGGHFNGSNSIGGQARNRIARLDATTGAADSFNPNANDEVQSIAVQTDGKILASGPFSNIGGQNRNRIARLDPATGLADSYDPNATGFTVFTMSLQPDGKILVGGNFTNIGGQIRNNIARLDPVTGLADSFNPNANNTVLSIAVQADGKVLAAGDFFGSGSIGGLTRNFIARLDGITGVPDSFDPSPVNPVQTVVVQPDGKILVGGSFGANPIGGQIRNYIARLDPTGSADSFNPNAGNAVQCIAVQADGKVLASGIFTTMSGVTRNRIARMETDGRLDQTLNLNTVGAWIDAIAMQPDGKIIIGGYFTSILGITRNNIARLNTDGTLDIWNPNADEEVQSIAIQTDGEIVVGGYFTHIGGLARDFIARLNPTSSFADPWDPGSNGAVFSLAIQRDNNILAGGRFSGIGGQGRVYIARLDPATGSADSFDPRADADVFSIVVQPDAKILVGGKFISIGGQPRNNIARLDPTTGLADSFNPNASNVSTLSEIDSIALQADGKILAGGNFSSIGGQARFNIARLDASTGLADSFAPNALGNSTIYVDTIAVQSDGKILAGGNFTSIGGQTRNSIGRLDPTTGLADSFNPNANDNIRAIAVQADGKLLVGGMFVTIGGQSRNRFARLTNDTAALQKVVVTQTTITWTGGGASPQFTRVTFEYSTDNVNYTFLGDGTATGSTWTLTGLNLPTWQEFYIRARGHYCGGYDNASESTEESVRNAFISGPTPPPSPTPTATAAASPTPTATATAPSTPTPPTAVIAGAVTYCPDPSLSPVPAVTMTLTGTSSGSTLTNSLGNYAFPGLPSGGNYTVTPTRPALPPGFPGITTVDVIAIQRHYLGTALLTGCRLAAADCAPPLGVVNTADVIAVQRFFLGLTTGIGNAGKFQFNPLNRSYSPLNSNQTGQNYDALVLGDVTSPYVY